MTDRVKRLGEILAMTPKVEFSKYYINIFHVVKFIYVKM